MTGTRWTPATPDSVTDDDARAVVVDGRPVPLPRFLAACAASLAPDAPADPVLAVVRDRFVAGGLAALAAPTDAPAWVQRGVDLPADAGRRRVLYGEVAGLVRDRLTDGTARNAFFLHKPPGLRLRLQRTDAGGDLDALVDRAVARWHDEGLVGTVEHGVYEPETTIFGGPRSMEFVHALFTVDSLVWLDRHAGAPTEDASPAWLVSLAALRSVLTGLEISGWEDLGVWAQVRDRAGRRLSDEERAVYAGYADAVRDVWARRDLVPLLLDATAGAAVAGHEAALLDGAQRWLAGYFTRPGVAVGPRAALAMYVVFHWNRGGLTPTEQAVVAEALAQRPEDASTPEADDDGARQVTS